MDDDVPVAIRDFQANAVKHLLKHGLDTDRIELLKKLDASEFMGVMTDRIFPFEATQEAIAYVETGRAKGKVVVKVK